MLRGSLRVVVRVVRSVGGGREGVNFTLWFGGLRLSYLGWSEGLDCCAPLVEFDGLRGRRGEWILSFGIGWKTFGERVGASEGSFLEVFGAQTRGRFRNSGSEEGCGGGGGGGVFLVVNLVGGCDEGLFVAVRGGCSDLLAVVTCRSC